MEKGSFSLSMLRWLEMLAEEGARCQKLFFSGGEGYRLISMSPVFIHCPSYW